MKKWLAALAAMSLLVPSTTLASINEQKPRIEMSHSANEELSIEAKYEFLIEKGIHKGKPDGTAQLEAELTRAELAVTLYRLYQLEKPVAKIAPFADSRKHWAKDELMAVHLKGWMGPDDGWKFSPNKKMTLEEVAEILVKATGLDIDKYASIWLPAGNQAQGYLAAALTENFLTGEADYRKKALRSHLVHSLYEIYHYENAKPGGIWEGLMEPKLVVNKENEDSKEVEWTFTVKNQTEKEQIVNISASQFDYILKKDGVKVEQYTDNKRWIMLYKETILKQGEELTYSGKFLDLAKGKYELEIWLIDGNWPNAKSKINFEIN
jgi:hypothetical protein